MISEEKLKDKIAKGTIVYEAVDNRARGIHLNNYHYIKDGLLYFHPNIELTHCNELYETKEEAEFIAKYHCNKIIRFEPPIFEEFINSNENIFYFMEDQFSIIMYKDSFRVRDDSIIQREFKFEDNNIESKKKAYYKAVKHARNIFLGEE